MVNKLNFRVSSALKNIIGKDLITDDFVAIFELVKNAFDAQAKNVLVEFKNVSSNRSQIIIKDDGKGMDVQDIEKKWLFVAYSAKKEGTEDYRSEIATKRIHAGAKGIGRFSCDRLGKSLIIYSRRSANEPISKLTVDWKDFEKDMQSQFEKISVFHEHIESCEYDLETGTVLEISNTRSDWPAPKLQKLRQSLEKLINPSQANDSDNFSIYLKATEFETYDAVETESGNSYNVINGPISNFLFEKLTLQTTNITVAVDKEGQTITTELFDRGRFVYRMVEENTFFYNETNALKDLKIFLFSLNQPTKAMFTKYMGVRPVHFGSVFVYKNGFRIHPIGELGRGDIFGLDNRKQQGTSRFFGTRDLVGRIEINGDNEEFQESSSRDGGLVRNDALKALQDFFISNVLKRLERFAIGVVKYGNIEDFDVGGISEEFPKELALEFIEALTKSDTINDIEFNPDIFDIVSNASEKSLSSLLKNLTRIAIDSKNDDLTNEVEKIQARLSDFSRATTDAEQEAKNEKSLRIIAETTARKEAAKAQQAQQETTKERQRRQQASKQSMFLQSMVSSDLDNIVALHHHIGIAAGTIENYVTSVSQKIRAGKPMTAESFLSVLDEISFVAKQIAATTKFATKANFNLEAELITGDLYTYIEEYVLTICSGLIKVKSDPKINVVFEWNGNEGAAFTTKFRPLEISMVIDGLIHNAVKAGATKIIFTSFTTENDFQLRISDNGRGIKENIKAQIFEMGFTTTKGSGLGLHHIKNIIQDMKGSITVSTGMLDSADFIIKLTR